MILAFDSDVLIFFAWIGADAFVTNNLKNFKPSEIEEIAVLSPADL